MSTLYRRKMFRAKPIKLNWFDLFSIWLSAKSDIASDWMNEHPFTSGFVFFFAVFCGLFLALVV